VRRGTVAEVAGHRHEKLPTRHDAWARDRRHHQGCAGL